MLKELLIIILLTFVPALELRASIPYGVLIAGINWATVFLVGCAANIILGLIIYYFIDVFIHLFLKAEPIKRIWEKVIERTQKKVQPYVEKYGEMGLAVFIGIPLPGSGVYTAAIAAYLLGMSYKKFFIATIWGVLIAGTIVTAIVLSGNEAWYFLIKRL